MLRVRIRRRDLWRKFFADRGPHLAAMIAYFALLSFVPLTFLSLSLLGLAGGDHLEFEGQLGLSITELRDAWEATLS